MAEQIWIRQGDHVQGPFPREKILAWMREGRILTSMLLSGDGTNWRMAAEAEDLLVDAVPAAVPAAVPVRPPAAAVPVARVETGRSARRPRRPRSGRRSPPVRARVPIGTVLAIVGVLGVAVLVGVLLSGKGDDAPAAKGDAPRAAHLTSREVVERSERSVALIRDQVASGTGFMVADGILATNAHVVRRMLLSDMEVLFPSIDRRTYRVDRLLHLDDDWDLCLLAIRANHRPLPLASTGQVPRGQELLIIGNPGLEGDVVVENAVSRGLAGGLTTLRNRPYLQISAPINPGNSGGPVLDDSGQVIGMVTMKATAREGLAFALPVTEIAAGLRDVKRQSTGALQKLNQKHLAGAIFLRLDLAGRGYLVLVLAYVEGVRRALSEGATTVEEATPYLPDISEAVARVRETTGSDLDRYIDFIQGAAWMDDELRESLLDFQQIVQMFESRAANRDVMSVISHISEFETLFGRFTALEADLRRRFDLPEEE